MQPNLRRFLSIVLLLVGLALIILSRTSVDIDAGDPIALPQKGFLAPDFSLQTIDGDTIRIEDFRGRPVILNFWATWCPPCRAEMPVFQSIFDAYHNRIAILAINAADQDTIKSVQTLQAQLGLTFPILLDSSGSVQNKYDISSLPTTFFIDSDGIITHIEIGGPLSEVGVRNRLEKMLVKFP